MRGVVSGLRLSDAGLGPTMKTPLLSRIALGVLDWYFVDTHKNGARRPVWMDDVKIIGVRASAQFLYIHMGCALEQVERGHNTNERLLILVVKTH
jgi:hypothetical protein